MMNWPQILNVILEGELSSRDEAVASVTAARLASAAHPEQTALDWIAAAVNWHRAKQCGADDAALRQFAYRLGAYADLASALIRCGYLPPLERCRVSDAVIEAVVAGA